LLYIGGTLLSRVPLPIEVIGERYRSLRVGESARWARADARRCATAEVAEQRLISIETDGTDRAFSYTGFTAVAEVLVQDDRTLRAD
jgi:hypothetical protein